MKKLLLVLTLALLLVMAVACESGETTAPESDTTTPIATSKKAPEATTEPKATPTSPKVTTTAPKVTTTVPTTTEPAPIYSNHLALSYDLSKKANTVEGIGTCKDDVIRIPPTDKNGAKIYRIKSLTCDAKEIIVPSGITHIAMGAFKNCPNLEKITLPATLTSVGEHIFENCPKLKTIEMAQNSRFTITNGCLIKKENKTVTSGSAFATIPDDGSVVFIGYAAFKDLPITSITIPESVYEISDYAFSGCSMLSSVTLPDTLVNLGRKAFDGTALYSDRNNWQNGAFYIGNHLIEVEKKTTEITLPEGLVTIASNAFEGSAVKSITLPASVRNIGDNAFYTSLLEEVTLNDGLTTVGNYAFQNTNVKIFIIPESVEKVGALAFSSLGLEHIYCYAETIPEGWEVTFSETTEWVTMGYNGEPIK
ncbi:MAG: leucine-rich repeat protein [Clostridia bacterium]|nr:leucine-rich repeat protein [Clostridia bacterium]